MKNCPRILVLSLVLFFQLGSHANAFSDVDIKPGVAGSTYNPILKMWLPNTFSMSVVIDDQNEEYFFFRGETGLGKATVIISYYPNLSTDLAQVATKALEWSKIAKENRVNIQKTITCMGFNAETCRSSGQLETV